MPSESKDDPRGEYLQKVSMMERDMLDVSRWLMQNNLSEEVPTKQNTSEAIEQLMNSLPPAKQANRLPTLNTPTHGKISPRNLFKHDDKKLNSRKLHKDDPLLKKNIHNKQCDNDVTVVNERRKNSKSDSLDNMTSAIHNMVPKKTSKDIKELNIPQINLVHLPSAIEEINTEDTVTPRRISIAWAHGNQDNKKGKMRIKWPSMREVITRKTEKTKCDSIDDETENHPSRGVTAMIHSGVMASTTVGFIPVEEDDMAEDYDICENSRYNLSNKCLILQQNYHISKALALSI